MNDWLFQEVLTEEYRSRRMKEAKDHNRFLNDLRLKTGQSRDEKTQQLVVYLSLRKRALS